MKSCGGTHVHVEIGVMHIVEPPEEGHHVVGPMPPPVGIIHEEKRRDHREPARQLSPVQQTNISILRPHRDRQRDRQHGQTDESKTGNRNNKIAHQPTEYAEMLAAQRKMPLQKKQRDEDQAENRAADIIP